MNADVPPARGPGRLRVDGSGSSKGCGDGLSLFT
jgi:hypothetical protein